MSYENLVRKSPTPREEIEDAGLLVWDLAQNLIYADTTVAKLFGLDAREAGMGLPVDAYVARVHDEDRAAFVKALSITIVAEHQQHEVYRVNSSAGRYRYVVGFGRTFRDIAGSPIFYSGIVVPACATAVDRQVLVNLHS
ncbi:PAS domain-containing protein [Agrobacterium genomosp. 13]|uniref:PAS fold-3 domain-containing protein n=1 Tax=Agrobacterium genomosp. 13 str. CFBP 6927 TaxID=1183428 RepID=A0ABP2BMS5_9HYPH|nr:PAS domain-containing protein [Agrobacterium genomosp. 13]CUX57874.1 hypothetical protein AGR13a_Lc30058 [Agrobacterium genomosp. 13 str. CFBP 6927]